MRNLRFFLLILVFSIFFHNIAIAAGDKIDPLSVYWSFSGPFGKFDRNSVNRGFLVYKDVCSACHSLKRFSFRNLKNVGMPDAMIKAIAASYEYDDFIDDYGDVTTRNGEIHDYFPLPYANDKAAAAANGGSIPPDLSLIVKARHDGANYLYSLLVGYNGSEVNVDGLYLNPYFEGGALVMAPPLVDDMIDYTDGTKSTVFNMAYDVVNFLQWVAEPEMENRKKIGMKSIIFVSILLILLIRVNRELWKNIK